MTDVVDAATRSRMMAGIKGANTSPEITIRRYLHSRGFRFRLHRKELPGRPDLILPKYNLAIFVHGCFWHRHRDCYYAKMPSTRVDFWTDKLSKNVARDAIQIGKLIDAGWRVLVIWECGVKFAKGEFSMLDQLIASDYPLRHWPEKPIRRTN